jgi:Cytochrome P450
MRRDLGGVTPAARFRRALGEVNSLIYAEIGDRRAAREAEERDDVLSLLLRARHEEGTSMTDGELRDALLTLLTAGHETTATGLSHRRVLRPGGDEGRAARGASPGAAASGFAAAGAAAHAARDGGAVARGAGRGRGAARRAGCGGAGGRRRELPIDADDAAAIVDVG